MKSILIILSFLFVSCNSVKMNYNYEYEVEITYLNFNTEIIKVNLVKDYNFGIKVTSKGLLNDSLNEPYLVYGVGADYKIIAKNVRQYEIIKTNKIRLK